jgi:hypothetical protein
VAEYGPRTLSLLIAIAGTTGACEDAGVEATQVDGAGSPCASMTEEERRFCNDPATLLQVEEGAQGQVLYAGTSRGTLHRFVEVSEAGQLEGESRTVSKEFPEGFGWLSCNVDGDSASELVLSRSGNLDPGLLLWNGELHSKTELRSSRTPSGPLYKAACVDIDGDGFADLAGTSETAELLVYRGSPDGFADEPIAIEQGLEPGYEATRADVFHGDGCTTALFATASFPNNSSHVHILEFDLATAQVTDATVTDVGVQVKDVRFDSFEGGDPLLVVTTAEGGDTLVFLAGDGCSPSFDPVGTIELAEIRRVHRLVGPSPELLIIGNERDGVVLIEARSDGPPILVRTWEIPAIDAEIIRFQPTMPRQLAISSAARPYLQLFALEDE